MNLSQAYPITNQSDIGNSFQLAPPSLTVLLPQPSTIAHARTASDDLNLAYFSNYFKLYHFDPFESLHSTQQFLQLRRRIRLLITILHNYRRIERQAPLASFLALHGARARHDDGARGNLER